jgi:glycosyltransferase involved in cell wall biosynthesis
VPFLLNIVSGMNYGPHVYTDTSREFYKPDIDALSKSDVVMHGTLPNSEILNMMDRSDFVLLPTLDESFGYSILEAMAGGTPCVASRICAIPEIISDGVDGILLGMAHDDMGRWVSVYESDAGRLGNDYQHVLNNTFDALAEQTCDRIMEVSDTGNTYENMSSSAVEKILSKFNASSAAQEWHSIYLAALGD